MSRKISVGSYHEAIVDDEDFDRIRRHVWSLSKIKKNLYAYCKIVIQNGPEKGKATQAYMHRLIMGLRPRDKREVDHINGNGLDNRKENLRVCTTHQNQCNQQRLYKSNKSGYRGVCWDKSCGRWKAQYSKNKKAKQIGYYDTPEEAARAFDAVAKAEYGEFCGKLNFPDDPKDKIKP